MPGQGVFVGEPLARPFGGVRQVRIGNAYEVSTRALRPGRYQLQAAPGAVGPYRSVGRIEVVGPGIQRVRLPSCRARAYRLVREPLVGGPVLCRSDPRSSTAWSLSRMPPHVSTRPALRQRALLSDPDGMVRALDGMMVHTGIALIFSMQKGRRVPGRRRRTRSRAQTGDAAQRGPAPGVVADS
jgi:hypothetical protein